MKSLKKIPAYAHFLLSQRDFISFFAGIIVSGYVVGISLNFSNNIYHWITVGLGLAIGICCYKLMLICARYEREMLLNAETLKDITTDANRLNAWEKMHENYKANYYFRMQAKQAIYVFPLTITVLCAIGILTLNKGNSLLKNREQKANTIENNELLMDIDSLLKISNNQLYIELRKSILQSIAPITDTNNKVDCIFDSTNSIKKADKQS